MPGAGCLWGSRGVPGWWPVPAGVCNNRVIACWGKGWDNYTLALHAHPLFIQHVGSGIISSWPTDWISLSLSLQHLNYPYPFPCEAARSIAQPYAWVRAGEITKQQTSRADYGQNCIHPSTAFYSATSAVDMALQKRQQQAPSWGQKASRFVETALLFPLQLCADVQLPAARGLSLHVTWHDSVYYIFLIIGTGIQIQMIST